MNPKEKTKWQILSVLIIIALAALFIIPHFVQANSNIPYQDTNEDMLNPYPAPASCEPYPGPYPGPYPDPYPGSCTYLPLVFSDFSLTKLLNEIIGGD